MHIFICTVFAVLSLNELYTTLPEMAINMFCIHVLYLYKFTTCMYWIQLIPIHAIKFANCVWNSALLLSISTLFISFSDLTNNVCTAQSALLRSFIIINCQTVNCINFYQHSIQMSCEWFNNIETKMDKTNIIYQNIEINSRTQCILYSMSSTICLYCKQILS